MSVIVRNACRIVGADNNPLENVFLDFSTAGEASFYIQNKTNDLAYDMQYKSNHPNIKVSGPKVLPSWHMAILDISWEPCDEGDYYIDIHNKMR